MRDGYMMVQLCVCVYVCRLVCFCLSLDFPCVMEMWLQSSVRDFSRASLFVFFQFPMAQPGGGGGAPEVIANCERHPGGPEALDVHTAAGPPTRGRLDP